MLYYTLAILCLAYYVCLAIYRLLLCPVSKFPGPRLAALTWWYEFYYDAVKNGQFYKEIERLHSIYGPIVRINPKEVHIKDPSWYSELNASASHIRDKSPWYPNPIAEGSIFYTVQHALHRRRRAALSPFFSKASVTSFSSLILSKVELLCARFAEKAGTEAVMNLYIVFTGLTLDVISHYSFGETMGLLEDGQFKVAGEWKRMFEDTLQSNIWARYFPLVPRVIKLLPDRLALSLVPSIVSLKRLEEAVYRKITVTFSNADVETAKSSKSTQRTIFEELRDSDLEPEEKSASRLADEALILVAAGSETTSVTLAVLTFYLLTTPQVLQKLTTELDAAIPDAQSPPPLQELEHLPYLRATILEAHRITAIVTGRLIRIAPTESLHYKQWVIPPNTPISMSMHWMHLDPSVFPSPYTFRPERFTEHDGKEKEKHVIPFSKGTRACIGLNLANAELVLTVALLFRRFEFELFQTDESDVRFDRDLFTGATRHGSEGIRVRVLGERV